MFQFPERFGANNECKALCQLLKTLLGFPSIGYGRQILFYTALIFFAVAAGYVCKNRLV